MPDLAPAVQDAVDRVNRLTYSPAEAALVLGVSRAHVYNMMKAGIIPSLHLGGRRLIRADALSDLTERLEGGGPDAAA